MKTIYTENIEISDSQIKIMQCISIWVHEKKSPTPFKEIISNMRKQGMKKETTIYSLKILIKKGYIRRSIDGGGNSKAAFVQLRSI